MNMTIEELLALCSHKRPESQQNLKSPLTTAYVTVLIHRLFSVAEPSCDSVVGSDCFFLFRSRYEVDLSDWFPHWSALGALLQARHWKSIKKHLTSNKLNICVPCLIILYDNSSSLSKKIKQRRDKLGKIYSCCKQILNSLQLQNVTSDSITGLMSINQLVDWQKIHQQTVFDNR